MKKTISVNISGIAFTIDEDAFQMLESYLNEIESRLNSYGEDSETIKDIESRISEIFTERDNGAAFVVNIELIKHVITVVGSPAIFGGSTESADNSSSTENTFNTTIHYTKTKKLTRSRADRVFGGVCAGVADYFGIDALVVRIITAIITIFSSGTLFLVYIILWIFVPEEGSESLFERERRGKKQ